MSETQVNRSTDADLLPRERLREVVRNYAEFRVAMQNDFIRLEAKLRQQEEQLHANDRYIHKLHQERAELRDAVAAARGDVEAFAQMLAEAQAGVRRLETARRSSIWWLVGPLFDWARKLGSKPEQIGKDLPGTAFTYYLHTSPFRIYQPGLFVLRGWAFSQDNRAITAIRARIDLGEYVGKTGIEEPEVLREHKLSPTARPGFEIEVAIMPGKHRLRIEACLDHRDWVSILNTWIWCAPTTK